MRARVVAVALVTVAALVFGGAPARATPEGDPLDGTVSTPLLVDCSSITAKGREYARLHGITLCDADSTPASEPLRTEAVGGEECGNATLVMISRGGGVATLAWRVNSFTGPVVDLELDISASGRSDAVVRRFVDRTASLHPRGATAALLGVGRASATVSGTVETFLATCRIAPAGVRIHAR